MNPAIRKHQSFPLLHEQGCSDSFIKSKNNIIPPQSSPPQTRNQATQYTDEFVCRLQSPGTKPLLSAEPSPAAFSTKSSLSVEQPQGQVGLLN